MNKDDNGANIVELDYEEDDEYYGEDSSVKRIRDPDVAFEEELKRDKTTTGIIIFNLYRIWVVIMYFENLLIMTISLTTGAMAQLVFLETSDNITQGVLYGWIVSIVCMLSLLIIYGGCWVCGAKRNEKLSKASPFRFVFMIMLCILLAIAITSVKNIARDCFDENGNYRNPKLIDKENEQFIIYCDVKSFI